MFFYDIYNSIFNMEILLYLIYCFRQMFMNGVSMLKNLSLDNLSLIHSLKLYVAKHINEMNETELEMFEKIERRLKNAEY